MKYLYESDKIKILDRIDAISKTINNRLLPTFDSIEKEAKEVGEKKFEDLSARFHPDYMDEGSVYEEAFDEEVCHYLLHREMKKEFMNSTVTWLFHLFEKDCSEIFKTNNGDNKKEELANLSIDTGTNSNWDLCNTELRLIANVIKHGKGQSFDKLKLRKPSVIKSSHGFISDAEIVISVVDLNSYIIAMQQFWNEFFEKALQFE